MEISVTLPPKLNGFFNSPARYRVVYGGRGSGKSWSIAAMLVVKSYESRRLILCARELQKSIKDSSHRLISSTIERLGCSTHFKIGDTSIKNLVTGSEFIFKGLRFNAEEIKSTEGIDICWVEEAQRISRKSIKLLVPTVRKEGSELWFTYNPDSDDDEVHRMFVINQPPKDAMVTKLNWQDNPWFTPELEASRLYDEQNDIDYKHIWEGEIRKSLEGSYFAGELADLRNAGKITSVPYNPEFAVSTYWDIGFSDYTSIWFLQKVGYEHRLIDFYQNNMEDPPHYATMLKGKGYFYNAHYLPHDADHLRMGMGGKSIAEQLRALIKEPIEVIKVRPDEITDIMATRMFIKRCAFDEEKCEEGLKSMRSFRRKWNDERKQFDDKPFKDWAKHAADAFRYLAIHCSDERDIGTKFDYGKLVNPEQSQVNMEGGFSFDDYL